MVEPPSKRPTLTRYDELGAQLGPLEGCSMLAPSGHQARKGCEQQPTLHIEGGACDDTR